MDGADILGIVALAIGGGAGAYVAWYVSRFGFGGGKNGHTPPGAAGSATEPGPRDDLPMTHDPLLAAEISALRAEVAAIAATQTRMLQEQTDREGMLLAEMRAVASVMDPKIVESLARIEDTVGTTGAAPPDPHADPDPPAEDERPYVVRDEREEAPQVDEDPGKTIRRG